MAILKCKTCGKTVEIGPNQSVAVCKSCGTVQTLTEAETFISNRKTHRKQVLMGILILVLLAVCVLCGRYIKNTLDEETIFETEEAVQSQETGFSAIEIAKEAAEEMAAHQADEKAAEKAAAYEQAMALLESEDYEAAIAAFAELGDYEDSAAQMTTAVQAKTAAELEAANAEAYEAAVKLLEEKKYEEAKAAFEALGDYSDAEEKATECQNLLDEQKEIDAQQQQAKKEADAQAAWEEAHPEKIVQADGMYHIYEYYPNGLLKSDFLYNVDGSNFNSHEYEYDGAGRKTKVTKKVGGEYLYSRGYEYNSIGKYAKTIEYNADGTFYAFNTYEYNDVGQLSKETLHNSDGTVDWYIIYEYNDAGQLIKETNHDPNGVMFSYDVYEYDSAGQKVRTTCYNADGTIWLTY